MPPEHPKSDEHPVQLSISLTREDLQQTKLTDEEVAKLSDEDLQKISGILVDSFIEDIFPEEVVHLVRTYTAISEAQNIP